MLGSPQYCSARKRPRTSQPGKAAACTALCVCLVLACLNSSLMVTRHLRTSTTVSDSNASVRTLATLKEAIHRTSQAEAFKDDAAGLASRSGSTWRSILRLSANSAAEPEHSFQQSLTTTKAELQHAMQALAAAGVQLNGLQQLRIDQVRMQAELYGKGRLQQRRAALEAELNAAYDHTSAANGDSAATSANIPYSRGILIVTGSKDQMANAFVSITVLRDVLNCSLPIELVYYGDNDQDQRLLAALRDFGSTQGSSAGKLTLIDGSKLQLDLGYQHENWATGDGVVNAMGPIGEPKWYAAKTHALAYATSFQQVLLLDADNLPLLDPAQLFELKEFATHGSLFWPDFWHKNWLKEEFYKILGQDVPWEIDSEYRSSESGQVLIDRLRHVDVLEWLWWLNAHQNVTYTNMLGDKDTYRLAFSLAGKVGDFQQVKVRPRDAMTEVQRHETVAGIAYVHQGMVQHTPDEKPAFMHRTDKAKLFPYCANHEDPDRCKVGYFTIPLTEAQANLAMNRGMVYNSEEANTAMYQAWCNKDMPVDPDRPDDPGRCGLYEGQDVQPIALVPVSEFKHADRVIQAAYAIYERVKGLMPAAKQPDTPKEEPSPSVHGEAGDSGTGHAPTGAESSTSTSSYKPNDSSDKPTDSSSSTSNFSGSSSSSNAPTNASAVQE